MTIHYQNLRKEEGQPLILSQAGRWDSGTPTSADLVEVDDVRDAALSRLLLRTLVESVELVRGDFFGNREDKPGRREVRHVVGKGTRREVLSPALNDAELDLRLH